MKTEDTFIAMLDPDQVQRASQGIAAELRRVAKRDKRKLVAAILALLLGAWTAFYYGNWPLGLFLLVMIFAVLLGLRKRSRRRRMGVALPFVLQALGLEEVAGGLDFNRSLPLRLLPRVAEPLVSTVFSGNIDGCPVTIAETKVRDRSDDSDQLMFEGLVLRVEVPSLLPDFLIVDEALSKKLKGSATGTWFFNKPHIDVGGLQPCPTFPSGMHGLGLWLSSDVDLAGQPLASVLKVLAYPPGEARITGRIYSATNDGAAIFVALRPLGKSIRFEMENEFSPNASLVIHATHAWLAEPLALAKALAEAAKTTAAKR
jgi:hypothetical protein